MYNVMETLKVGGPSPVGKDPAGRKQNHYMGNRRRKEKASLYEQAR